MRILIILFLLTGCKKNTNTSSKEVELPNNNKFVKNRQVLLINDSKIKDTLFVGNSSFLVSGSSDTYLCTSMYIFGSLMGLQENVLPENINSNLNYLTAYARKKNISTEVVTANKLLNSKQGADAIALFSIKNTPKQLQALKPRFSKIKNNEPLNVIACQFADADCNQEVYEAIVIRETMNYKDLFLISVNPDHWGVDFDGEQMCGAPVIDSQGFVVGAVTTIINDLDEIKMIVTSIKTIEEWL